mmetsp:Transcript_36257/g.54122  ORF Transcript_36257/g.54122 Transcript_36257/m.54122 type:complete len:128 (+) Transcript_36257:154-537(+)
MALALLLSWLLLAATTVAFDGNVDGVRVHKVPLMHPADKETSVAAVPFCLAVSSTLDLPTKINFLSTQVWPSARVAARCLLESSVPSEWSVCELGCGPGLPSLSAATICQSVTATDLDSRSILFEAR